LKKPFLNHSRAGLELLRIVVNGAAINMMKHVCMSEKTSEFSDLCPNIKNRILQLDKSQGPGLSLSTCAWSHVFAVLIFVLQQTDAVQTPLNFLP